MFLSKISTHPTNERGTYASIRPTALIFPCVLNRMRFFSSFNKLILGCLIFSCFLSVHVYADGLMLKSKGWYDIGRIMASTDSIRPLPNYNGNWLESFGAHFTVFSDIGQHWEGAMGIGGFQTHTAQSSVKKVMQTKKVFIPIVTQAQFTYRYDKKSDTPFQLSLGYFPYIYNPHIQNLGAYLLRGPVYPGLLYSEFESHDIDPSLANTLGAWSRFRFHQFTWDVLLKSETDLPPAFDLSVISVLNYKFGEIFHMGAGINLHRAFAAKKGLTDLDTFNPISPNAVNHPYDWDYGFIDTVAFDSNTGTATLDTTRFTHRGIKLMGMFFFDPKPLFSSEIFGKKDLQFYVEAAIIGIKDQAPVYTEIKERMPFVVGFTLPTFNVFDQVTLEIEWYGAKFKNDLARIKSTTSPVPVNMGFSGYNRNADSLGRWTEDSTVLLTDPFDVTNLTKDDWKWSLYMSKTLQEHVNLSFQIANDHFRPNSHANSGPRETAFSKLSDYYIKFRTGYTF